MGFLAAAWAACAPAAYVVVDEPVPLPPPAPAPMMDPPVVVTTDDYTYSYVDVPYEPVGDSVSSVEEFYEPLAAYGDWTESPSYGWVFAPSQPDYIPYSNGYWLNTDYGMTWVSNEPYGWAVNHYGRWVYETRWVWVPDTTWGPAWVDWRETGGYVGWAPMPPRGGSYCPASHWRFVNVQYVYNVDVRNYYHRASPVPSPRDLPPPPQRWVKPPKGNGWNGGPNTTWANAPQKQRPPPAQLGRYDAGKKQEAVRVASDNAQKWKEKREEVRRSPQFEAARKADDARRAAQLEEERRAAQVKREQADRARETELRKKNDADRAEQERRRAEQLRQELDSQRRVEAERREKERVAEEARRAEEFQLKAQRDKENERRQAETLRQQQEVESRRMAEEQRELTRRQAESVRQQQELEARRQAESVRQQQELEARRQAESVRQQQELEARRQ
ncbi:MAG: hypothetical protein JNK82_38405, partial [Myxococcaceae bacterium]|nr:hypothetical protein [Myxococcaceae bacterium]